MPPKTVAEVAQMVTNLQREHEVFAARATGRLSDLERLDLYRLRERLAVIEALLADLQKRHDEAERRRWQLSVLFLGSVLTLAVQVAVIFLKK